MLTGLPSIGSIGVYRRPDLSITVLTPRYQSILNDFHWEMLLGHGALHLLVISFIKAGFLRV